jgi:hypothetical protein
MKMSPNDTSRNVQQTAYLSFLVASRRVTEGCLRMLEKQQRTLAAAQRRRRADDGGCKPECPGGAADLHYHYGRRCHDVDIERL